MEIESSQKFTSLQLELLKLYSFEPSEAELKEVRHMLATFFMERFQSKLDEAAAERGISDETLDEWLNEAAVG